MSKNNKYTLPTPEILYNTVEISMRDQFDIETKTFSFMNHQVNVPNGMAFKKNGYDISDAAKVIYVNLDEAIKKKITWRQMDDIWEYHFIFRETHDYLFKIDLEQELKYILNKCGDIIDMADFEQMIEKEDIYSRLIELAQDV